MSDPPGRDDVVAAAERIRPFVVETPVLNHRGLDDELGVTVLMKAENRQRAGAFKMRGATNAVQSLDVDRARRGVAAHSSGNHAAALALAAADRGVDAHLVMPRTTPRRKVENVERHGGTITFCEPTLEARDRVLREVLERTGAIEVHPYDDPLVIAGAGTAARELLQQTDGVDAIVAPVSGAGLMSGTAIAAHGEDPDIVLWGVEPAGADDAARALAAGHRVDPGPLASIADGLLATPSDRTFSILRDHVAGIATVADPEIVEATLWYGEELGEAVEPSGAASLAGVRSLVASGSIPAETDGRPTRVGLIISGGNLDPSHLSSAG